MDYFIKKEGGKYPLSSCRLLPDMGEGVVSRR